MNDLLNASGGGENCLKSLCYIIEQVPTEDGNRWRILTNDENPDYRIKVRDWDYKGAVYHPFLSGGKVGAHDCLVELFCFCDVHIGGLRDSVDYLPIESQRLVDVQTEIHPEAPRSDDLSWAPGTSEHQTDVLIRSIHIWRLRNPRFGGLH